MDIKEIILIGGGLLLAAIVGHGLWIAQRARRGQLKMDISPKSFRDAEEQPPTEEPNVRGELPNGGARIVSVVEDPAPRQDSLQLDVNERQSEKDLQRKETSDRQAKAKAIRSGERKTPGVKPVRDSVRAEKSRTSQSTPPGSADTKPAKLTELIVINVLAGPDQVFGGAELVTALRQQGLRFGEMNILHCVDEASSSQLYSVANAVEPGTFDLADLPALQSPGLTFFLQLPTVVEGIEALESMLRAAQNVANELGGELKDENMSAMTGQTAEHLRQRVSDFARRYLTQQAAELD